MGVNSDRLQQWSILPISAVSPSLSCRLWPYGVDFPYFDAYAPQLSREPLHGTILKVISTAWQGTDFLIASSRVVSSCEPALAEVYRGRIPLRLRAELLGQSTRRQLCKPRLRNLSARQAKIAQNQPFWSRFDAGAGLPIRLIQCAEQLGSPKICCATYSSTGRTTRSIPKRWRAAIAARLAIWDSRSAIRLPGRRKRQRRVIPKPPCNTSKRTITGVSFTSFGEQSRRGRQSAFSEGDRNRWFVLQPYLIAILMSRPADAWRRPRFGENYFLPDWCRARGAIAPSAGIFLRQSWPSAGAIGTQAFRH